MERNEKIKMLCAEVGVEIRPEPDDPNKFRVGPPHNYWPDEHPAIIASRKASALANLSDGRMRMNCITHRRTSDKHRCLGVSTTEVIANPMLRCGAP